jgi:hypothetical protein
MRGMGIGEGCGLAGSQTMSTAVHVDSFLKMYLRTNFLTLRSKIRFVTSLSSVNRQFCNPQVLKISQSRKENVLFIHNYEFTSSFI